MQSAQSYAIVLVTAPATEAARDLAKGILQARLAACANIVPRLESLFWWEGKVETSQEALILLKTRRELLPALEEHIITHHPYDLPEFLVVAPEAGAARYLEWIDASCPVKAPAAAKAKRPAKPA